MRTSSSCVLGERTRSGQSDDGCRGHCAGSSPVGPNGHYSTFPVRMRGEFGPREQADVVPRSLSLAEAWSAVRTRGQLLHAGMSSRAIAQAVASGVHRRLQRNRYVRSDLWEDLWPESRHLLEVCGVEGEMRNSGAVASYESAGVLRELPLFRHTPIAVHVTMPTGSRMSSRPGLARHTDLLPEADVAPVAGIRCTTLDRTVFDLARTLSWEAAVAAADAALRQVAMKDDRYDEFAAEQWRERMLERCARARGVRGIRQAEPVIRFADGRSESTGESVSRAQLWRLGFRRLRPQIPVAGPNGQQYRVDLGIEDADAFLEFDGLSKYLDEAMRSGRTIEQVVLAEKRREDWIRGTTQKRFARAETPHILTPDALGRRLAAFGILPPAR